MLRAAICILVMSSVSGHLALAATSNDPEWPCIQRKVPHLAVAQMWAGPPVDEAREMLADDSGVSLIASRIALRRVSLEDAEKLIVDYAGSLGPDRNRRLTAVFGEVFDLIDKERAIVISGIGRYARKQEKLSDAIEERRAELARLLKETPLNHDRIEELEDTLAWDTRIFDERRQSLTYVCETPVILEQRLFSLARIIQGQLDQ